MTNRMTLWLTQVMVLGAVGVALFLAYEHGTEKGTSGPMQIAFVVGLGVVVLMEYIAWHNAACSWFERRLGSVALWSTVGVALTAGTLYTNFSAGAGNNSTKAGLQQTSMMQQGDLNAAVRATQAQVAQLEQRLTMAPVRTPEAARAAQDVARAHRFWGLTEQCTKTMGPETRRFCSDYASAVADESMATQALQDREELRVARVELARLFDERRQQRLIVDEDQPQIILLSSVGGLDVTTARQADAMALPLLMQIVILFGGVATAAEVYRHRQRVPWVNWAAWARRISTLRAIARGTDHRPDSMGAVVRLEASALPQPPPTVLERMVTDRQFALAAAKALREFRPKGQAA